MKKKKRKKKAWNRRRHMGCSKKNVCLRICKRESEKWPKIRDSYSFFVSIYDDAGNKNKRAYS